MKSVIRLSLIVASVAFNIGCTSVFEMGESPTYCPINKDPGLPCTSTREVMELASSPDGISREKERRKLKAASTTKSSANKKQNNKKNQKTLAKSSSSDCTECGAGQSSLPPKAANIVPDADPVKWASEYRKTQDYDAFLPAPEPIAVRQPPRMLRVMIKPYEDSKGRLQNVGYVYSEIEERKYRYGRGVFDRPARITPLHIRQTSLEEERQMNEQGDQGLGIVTQSAVDAAGKAAELMDQTPNSIREAWPAQ